MALGASTLPRYKPLPITGLDPDSPEGRLAGAVNREFNRIAAVVNILADGHIDPSYAAPSHPTEGDIRYADGTSWNPGSGRGIYQYRAGAWVFVGGGGGGGTGATGPAGPAVFLLEQGLDGEPGAPGAAGIAGNTGAIGPTGPAVFLLGEAQEGEQGPPGVAGIAGAAGTQGAIGPAGPAVFLLEEGLDGEAGAPGATGATGSQGIQGVTGNTGAIGPAGPAIFLLEDGLDGDPGPPGAAGGVGTQGLTGGVGPAGPAIFLLEDGADGDPGPPGAAGAAGAAGSAGTPGTTGVAGPPGPAIFLLDEAYDGEPGAPGAPGATGVGTTGPAGPPGPAIFLLEEIWPDDPMRIPGSPGAAGLLSFAGGKTANTTINDTTTFTTGGVTLLLQTAVANAVWRVRAMGQFVAVSSATARTAQAACFWGSTQLTLVSALVLASVAQTSNWVLEFILTASSTTAIWTTGNFHNKIDYPALVAGSSSDSKLDLATPASTVVTAGAQTLDLRFNMTAAVATDQWVVQQVTMERLN
jgi:hypothetical protein